MVTDWETKCREKREDSRDDKEFLENVYKHNEEGSYFFKQLLKVLGAKNTGRKFVPAKYGSLYNSGTLALLKSEIAKVFNPSYVLFVFNNSNEPLQCILIEEQHPIFYGIKESKIREYSFKGRTINDLIRFYERENDIGNIINYLEKMREVNKGKLDLLILHTDGKNPKRYCLINDGALKKMHERNDFTYYHQCRKYPEGKKYMNFYDSDVEWKNYDMSK